MPTFSIFNIKNCPVSLALYTETNPSGPNLILRELGKIPFYSLDLRRKETSDLQVNHVSLA